MSNSSDWTCRTTELGNAMITGMTFSVVAIIIAVNTKAHPCWKIIFVSTLKWPQHTDGFPSTADDEHQKSYHSKEQNLVLILLTTVSDMTPLASLLYKRCFQFCSNRFWSSVLTLTFWLGSGAEIWRTYFMFGWIGRGNSSPKLPCTKCKRACLWDSNVAFWRR